MATSKKRFILTIRVVIHDCKKTRKIDYEIWDLSDE
jgi:hypothetical protein